MTLLNTTVLARDKHHSERGYIKPVGLAVMYLEI